MTTLAVDKNSNGGKVNMEKTIEERAKEYGEFTDKNGGRTCEWSYYKGATDQQKIDIENACKWLQEHVRMVDYLPTFVSSITHPMYGDEFVNMFKAAMEEK